MYEKGEGKWIVFFFSFSWFVFSDEFCVDKEDKSNDPDNEDDPGEGDAIVTIRCLCGVEMIAEENETKIAGYGGLLILR